MYLSLILIDFYQVNIFQLIIYYYLFLEKIVLKAFENAFAIEACALMAYHTMILNPKVQFPNYILDKHFSIKYGRNSYYVQI